MYKQISEMCDGQIVIKSEYFMFFLNQIKFKNILFNSKNDFKTRHLFKVTFTSLYANIAVS